MGTVVCLLEHRYARLYREHLALWLSRGLRLPACHQIAAHLCS